AASRRTASCPCGSARRYKHCCGRLVRERGAAPWDSEVRHQAVLLRRAAELMNVGEATAAEQVLAALRPNRIGHAAIALEAAEIYLEMHRLQRAAALLQRALELGSNHPRIVAAHEECCALEARRATWQSAGATLRTLLERLNARARRVRRVDQVHIVGKL